MKEWSKSWKASVHPRKQRKYAAHLPLHARKAALMSPLSAELKKKYQRNAVPVRQGDMVKILRGNHAGKTAKVEAVQHTACRLQIAGIRATRKDGTQKPYLFHPSKVMITEVDLSDKKREATFQRKTQTSNK